MLSASVGEAKLYVEIQHRNLTEGLTTDRWILLDEEDDGVKATKPDFWWPKKQYVIYLDGDKVHRSVYKLRKDRLITEALERRGMTVDRFSYSAPLSNWRCREIVDAVEKRLGELET